MFQGFPHPQLLSTASDYLELRSRGSWAAQVRSLRHLWQAPTGKERDEWKPCLRPLRSSARPWDVGTQMSGAQRSVWHAKKRRWARSLDNIVCLWLQRLQAELCRAACDVGNGPKRRKSFPVSSGIQQNPLVLVLGGTKAASLGLCPCSSCEHRPHRPQLA